MTAATLIADASAAITRVLAQAGPSLAQKYGRVFMCDTVYRTRGGW